MILCSLGSLVLLGRTTNSRFRKSKITWPADSAGKYPFASYTIVIKYQTYIPSKLDSMQTHPYLQA